MLARRSRLAIGLAQPLLYVVGLATAVGLYETARELGYLPAELPDLLLRWAGKGKGPGGSA